MLDLTLLPYSPSYEKDCADIIAALPDWFGIPEANEAYLESLNKFPSWIAIKGEKVVGVITLIGPYPGSFEIHFMAVHPSYHRQGVGKKLVEHIEEEARKSEGKWLHVKTLSPSHPDPYYARTREFYFSLGFQPLFESDTMWGADNPAIILIKSL
jgi:GNAT superfamily N-acetyltransferase